MKKALILLSLISSVAAANPTFKQDSVLPALVQQTMASAIITHCPTAFDFTNSEVVEISTDATRAREDRYRYRTVFQVINSADGSQTISINAMAYGNLDTQPDNVDIISIESTNNLCQ